MKKQFLLLLFCSVCIAATAQSWQDTISKIEKIFSRYKPDKPGTELAISRNGKIIFSKAWGMADLEHNVPLTTESITEAGSVSKQFTAAAILLLEQQGKLSLDDDVRKYVPELKDYGTTITLRHMMQHKSGLKDWGAIAGIAGWPRSTKTYNNNDALYIISNQKTLNHKPGDEYLYSNSNYNLFAIIVERVSGMSLAEFTRKNIFEPAGMKHTSWRDDYRRIVRNRAIAYSRSGSGHQTNMPNEYVYGNGGLLTTAEDLVTWCNYYLNGKLGNPSLLNKQIATTAFNNGVMHRYAAGLFVGTYLGWNYHSHDGATAGYRSNLDVFPELGLSIAWLSNTSEFDSDTLNAADAIAELFVPVNVPDPPQAQPRATTISLEKLKGYAGWYRNSRTGGGVKLSVQNDKLYVSQGGQLTPVSDDIFASGNNRIVMRPKGLLFITSTRDTTYYTSVEEAKLDERAMSEYTGEYYSEEAEAKLHVLVKNGKLFIQQKPKTELPISPTYKDGFESPAGIIYFEREDGKISSFKVSVGRARNVEFKKIK